MFFKADDIKGVKMCLQGSRGSVKKKFSTAITENTGFKIITSLEKAPFENIWGKRRKCRRRIKTIYL